MKIDVATIPELSELLPNLLRECSKREVDMTKIDVLINAGAFDVVLELVYLSLVHYHHDIERDEIRQFVNMQNTQEVLALIMDLSSVANDNKSGKVKNPRRAKAKPKT